MPTDNQNKPVVLRPGADRSINIDELLCQFENMREAFTVTDVRRRITLMLQYKAKQEGEVLYSDVELLDGLLRIVEDGYAYLDKAATLKK